MPSYNGDNVRAEDWVFLAICVFGVGVQLREASKLGNTSLVDGVLDWKEAVKCLRHPINCTRDTAARVVARGVWPVGILAVGLTVALRKYYPKWSGLPYGILLALLAVLMFAGGLDELLKSLDPRSLLDDLGLTKPKPGEACHSPIAICAGRGGQLRYSTDAGSSSCGTVVCNDHSAWDLDATEGKPPVQLSPAVNCFPTSSACSGRGGIAKVWQGVPNPLCGSVQCNDGSSWDLATMQMLSTPRPGTCIDSAALCNGTRLGVAGEYEGGRCGLVMCRDRSVWNKETGLQVTTGVGGLIPHVG